MKKVIKKNTSEKIEDNPLNDSKKEGLDLPLDFYSIEDKAYLSYLQNRLENSRNQKNKPLPEFNNKTYYQDYEENQKIATTKLPQKVNDDDVIVSAGTIENKLEALLSHVNGLDLTPEVLSYDRENNIISELGLALTDTIALTEELDGIAGDDENKTLRQRELLTQSAVFIQEEWKRTFEKKKKLTKKYNGEFKDWNNWTEKLELVFEGPSRTLLYGPNVYLGDITEYFMDKQPYFFVTIQQSYDIAKTKYGKFENWKYVKRGEVKDTSDKKNIYDAKWRLTSIKDNNVEITLYQDQPNDEFQILINSIPMLPIGFPLSEVSPGGKYNVVKQVLKPKNSNFAYGTSFVSSGSIKEISNIIDEMLKLFVLKTRKSFSRPYVNTSGRVISRRVLSPGRITMGIPADVLQPIGEEGNGVTSSEFGVLKELQDRIDRSTVSATFTGQQGKSGTTATEIMEMQRQSKLTLGLIISANVFMEKKLAYLRLFNILENWFNPIDSKVIKVNNIRKYVNSFRKTVRQVNIEGQGLGERQIIPMDTVDEKGNNDLSKLPNQDEIRQLEMKAEEKTGKPTEMIFLSSNGIKTAKLRWYIVITPKEKESSAFFKVLFREQLNDMMALMQLGSKPNMDGLEEEFSRVWGKSRNKLFSKQQNVSPEMGGVSPGEMQGRSNQKNIPNMKSVTQNLKPSE